MLSTPEPPLMLFDIDGGICKPTKPEDSVSRTRPDSLNVIIRVRNLGDGILNDRYLERIIRLHQHSNQRSEHERWVT